MLFEIYENWHLFPLLRNNSKNQKFQGFFRLEEKYSFTFVNAQRS
jgi:hypothetical protein